jgi:hypothetical protein|tara:strand:- start:564 stop:743 length:180 start_codon:yes stop_codon:yes gene_type:complete
MKRLKAYNIVDTHHKCMVVNVLAFNEDAALDIFERTIDNTNDRYYATDASSYDKEMCRN